MKINISFFLINHNSIGGVERVTLSLLKKFDALHIKTKYIFSLGDTSRDNKIIQFPEHIKIIGLSKEHFIEELKNHIKKNNITHLIFQGDNMTISKNILKAIKQTNCKAFLHYHGSPYAYLRKNIYWYDIKENPINIVKNGIAKVFYPFKKAKLLHNIQNSTDGFITVSNGAKKELQNIYKRTFNNIVCIHNPASFIQEEEPDNTKKEKVVILISRLVRKHKNVLLALRTWKHLHQKYPDWELQILGGGLLLPKLKKYISDYSLQNVNLVGHVNNVDDYLKKSAISLSTSDTEGFSMTTYEAMSFKIPIVLTKSYGGIYDIVTDKKNGLFSPKDDDKKLAQNLELLINDEELRLKMGNESYQKYEELQKEDIISQWIKVLQIKQ